MKLTIAEEPARQQSRPAKHCRYRTGFSGRHSRSMLQLWGRGGSALLHRPRTNNLPVFEPSADEALG